MTIRFNTSQMETTVTIDENKKIEELIKLYFKSINQPYLFGDPSIHFIYNAELLKHNSKDLVKSLKRLNGYGLVIVFDDEEKISMIY